MAIREVIFACKSRVHTTTADGPTRRRVSSKSRPSRSSSSAATQDPCNERRTPSTGPPRRAASKRAKYDANRTSRSVGRIGPPVAALACTVGMSDTPHASASSMKPPNSLPVPAARRKDSGPVRKIPVSKYARSVGTGEKLFDSCSKAPVTILHEDPTPAFTLFDCLRFDIGCSPSPAVVCPTPSRISPLNACRRAGDPAVLNPDAIEKPDPCTLPVAGVHPQTDPTEIANR